MAADRILDRAYGKPPQLNRCVFPVTAKLKGNAAGNVLKSPLKKDFSVPPLTRLKWQPHTVRGAIAGALKKKLGLDVQSEKVEGRGTRLPNCKGQLISRSESQRSEMRSGCLSGPTPRLIQSADASNFTPPEQLPPGCRQHARRRSHSA